MPNEDGISLCEKFADFFYCKIKKIIDTINSITFNNNEIELPIEPIPNLTLSKFNVPSRDTISRLILSFRKSSPHDPIPLSLFKLIAYPLSNYIFTIIKLSFTKESGEYINKHTIICPIIKDHNIDKNILGNYIHYLNHNLSILLLFYNFYYYIMSHCYHCSFPTNSEFLSCISCNSTIHLKCLDKAKCISSKWINKNTPSIAVLQIFSSANFKFTCTSCLNTSISSSTRPYNSMYPNTSSQPSSLSSSNSNILDSHPSISTTISLSSISNEIKDIKSMLSKIYIKSYAEALSNSNDSIINTYTLIDNNSPIYSDRYHRNSNNINQTSNSIVLGHITDVNKNNNYVNSIFKYLDINTNIISNVVYSSKLVTIIFNSQYAKSICSYT